MNSPDFRRLLLPLVLCGCLSAPPLVRAEGSTLHTSFLAFCGEWMKKLDQRERHNARKATPQTFSSGIVIRYTGYAEEPRTCEVKGNGKPGATVGRLVYTEYVMQKWGPSTEDARAHSAEVAARTEVTELFRYDGSRWQY